MLSQTVEYALRAMIHLAALDSSTAVSSEAIAESTQVPQGFLSKILRDLVVAELVTSRRGPHGGYALARPAAQISMLDVINGVDPIRRITHCPLGNPAHLQLCPLHRRLDDALGMIEHEFQHTSLAEVLASSSRGTGRCQSLVTPTVQSARRTPRRSGSDD